MEKVELLKAPKNIDLSTIKKILVIKLRAIGDVLLTTPVIQNLRKNFPDAQIDFVTEPPSKDIISENPNINNLIILKRNNKGFMKFLFNIRKTEYDLVFDLFCNPRSAQISFFSNAKYRVGYPFRFRGYAYNIWVKTRSDVIHNIDFNLDALRSIGLQVTDRIPKMYISDNIDKWASSLMKEIFDTSKLIIGINAGGGWETKLWGFHKFAELSDMLIEKLDAQVFLFWGPKEEYIYERIQSMMHYKSIVAPPTSLKEMASLFKKCNFVISNDSGPMHISASMGTPTFGIYGPTTPLNQGPVGKDCETITKSELNCLGCSLTKCNIGNLCMTQLSVEEVFTKIIKWQNINLN